ncbi:MAG: type II secretion system protein GspC [Thermodesulfobacteriota bacterium]|nr:type II secretion system protein GspC [Thermodesulfobacteriota bacterium]
MLLKRLFILIHLSIIGLIVWGISGIFLTIVSSKLDVPLRAKGVTRFEEPIRTVKHPFEYHSVIAEKNIFNPLQNTGKKGTKKETPDTNESSGMSLTKLNLELKGTMLRYPDHPFAIIEDKDMRKQDLYTVGDTIKDATVTNILKDKVILMRNGQEETLIMTYEKSKSAPKISPRKKSRPVERVGRNKFVLDKDRVSSTVGDLTQFMTQLNVRPYYESGKSVGFQITRIKPNSLISQMGLRRGDIIKSVNNITIENPEQAIEVYKQLQNESSLTIDVERRGRNMTYNYEIR